MFICLGKNVSGLNSLIVHISYGIVCSLFFLSKSKSETENKQTIYSIPNMDYPQNMSSLSFFTFQFVLQFKFVIIWKDNTLVNDEYLFSPCVRLSRMTKYSKERLASVGYNNYRNKFSDRYCSLEPSMYYSV